MVYNPPKHLSPADRKPDEVFRPTRALIDPVSPDNPAILWNWDRSQFLANGAALDASGADCSWDGVECEGGVATGRLGVQRGEAQYAFLKIMPSDANLSRFGVRILSSP